MIIEAEADVPLANYGIVEKIEPYSGTDIQVRHVGSG